MPSPFTHTNLAAVDDSAPKFGLDEYQAARFANGSLETTTTGISHVHVKPGKRPPFAHRHDQAEEVYVVISGSGRVKLDDEVVELAHLDAIRVAPTVVRAFEAGPDGLELLAVGARYEGDGELIQNFWTD